MEQFHSAFGSRVRDAAIPESEYSLKIRDPQNRPNRPTSTASLVVTLRSARGGGSRAGVEHGAEDELWPGRSKAWKWSTTRCSGRGEARRGGGARVKADLGAEARITDVTGAELERGRSSARMRSSGGSTRGAGTELRRERSRAPRSVGGAWREAGSAGRARPAGARVGGRRRRGGGAMAEVRGNWEEMEREKRIG
jgi:hypothetical protein